MKGQQKRLIPHTRGAMNNAVHQQGQRICRQEEADMASDPKILSEVRVAMDIGRQPVPANWTKPRANKSTSEQAKTKPTGRQKASRKPTYAL